MAPEDTLAFLMNATPKLGLLTTINVAHLIKDTNKTYHDFVSLLYEIIDLSVKEMQRHANHYINDGEEKLTKQLFNALAISPLTVSHELDCRGHVDVVVSCKQRDWIWLGESKIHTSGYNYLNKGIDQLLERYSIADDECDHGVLLILIKKQNAAGIRKKWQEKIASLQKNIIEFKESKSRKDLSFNTRHKHSATGLTYHIKHIGVALYYNPVDGRMVQNKPEEITKEPTLRIPYFTEKIAAGFPTSISGELDNDGINLHEKFVTNPEKSYVLQVSGLSMIGAGIPEGALVLVEKIPHKHRDIVVALINGENTLKRFVNTNNKLELHPENPDYPIIEFKETDEISIQGVVTCVMFRP